MGAMDSESRQALFDYRGDTDLEFVASAFVTRGRDAAGNLNLEPTAVRLAIGPRARPRNPPLVSCLMPTRNRFDQVKFAVDSFRRQTWPNKELIVLDQNRDDRLKNWLNGLNDPRIRVFHLPGAREPLGTLRNLTIDVSSGPLLCAWDDDDLHHPARLEIEIAAMVATRFVACTLIRETVWTPSRQRVGVRKAWPYCNTVVTLRNQNLRYPPRQINEDVPAVHAILARSPAILLDLPELYVYVVHGRNTCTPEFLEGQWAEASDRTEGAASQPVLARLGRVYPVAEYAAADAASMAKPPPNEYRTWLASAG
jgi:hypothetical protein